MLDDVFPIRGVIVAAQVRLELAAENLQGSTLSDTVGSYETKNLAGSGHRQTMQLETVGTIAVGNLAFQIGRQVDDGDGVKGAFLRANTTSNAQRLRDEGEARLRRDFDAELSTADDRARLLTLLTTLSRTTLFGEGNESARNDNNAQFFFRDLFRGGVGGGGSFEGGGSTMRIY